MKLKMPVTVEVRRGKKARKQKLRKKRHAGDKNQDQFSQLGFGGFLDTLSEFILKKALVKNLLNSISLALQLSSGSVNNDHHY